MIVKAPTKIISKLLGVTIAASFVTVMNAEPVFAAKKKRKNLLEQLFPKAAQRARLKRKKQQQRLLGIKAVQKTKKSKLRKIVAKENTIEKVEGPTYYTYSPEKFRALSTKPIIAAIISNREQLKREKQQSIEKQSDDKIELIKSEKNFIELDNTKTGMIRPSGPSLNEVELGEVSIKMEAEIAKAIEDHYAKNPQYIWLDKEYNPNEHSRTMLYAFLRADAYGLNASNFEIRSIEKLMGEGMSRLDAAINFEFTMTANALRYMADAKDGVINPNKISGYHDFGSYKRRYDKHLEKLATVKRPAKALFQAHPNNPQFKFFKRELVKLQNMSHGYDLEPIKSGTFIRPGYTHNELPKIIKGISIRGSQKLRDDHKVIFETQSSSTEYTDELVALVKDFQIESSLSPDGIIGRNTLNKLVFQNPKTSINRIKLAMERLRWLPENLGSKHVFINQPAYNASYIVNNVPKLSMRAIVGKKSNQTNFFYDTIETVEFNPYWNVPRSILVNEKLSKLQQNPYYYQTRGFEILKHGRNVVDPGSIDWYDEKSTKKYFIRQKPGGSNALGELKILFPNKHSIYMHDTPSRGLFKNKNRALSHGCVRLHKPREMAAAVLGTKISKVNSFVGAGKNKAVKVPAKMPVYVSYFTAWPDSNGKVKYYPDIYGRDKSLDKAFEKTQAARLEAFSS